MLANRPPAGESPSSSRPGAGPMHAAIE
jgi:hypothetical protein